LDDNPETKEDIAILREGGRRHAAILRELGRWLTGMHAVELENRARELIAKNGDKAAFLNYKPYGANDHSGGSMRLD